MLGQQVSLDSCQHRFLCWWQRAGDPQPTAFSILTTGVTTHRYHKTDQLPLRATHTCFTILPKDFYRQALRETAALSHRPRTGPPALTTGPQVTAKDLVNQRRGLGLAIQPRDSSGGSHTAAPQRPPCVPGTASQRAAGHGEQGGDTASASLLSQCQSSRGGTRLRCTPCSRRSRDSWPELRVGQRRLPGTEGPEEAAPPQPQSWG